ncbi:MAG: DUF5686 and carboxypeptidase regulatory-like domain-containing protein [Flavobacteriaceae bacterium]
MRYLFVLFFCSLSVSAQLKGTITDLDNQPIPFVNVYIENSYTGTTSNEQGRYELAVPNPGKYTIVFQFLGFKTQIKTIEIKTAPYTLDITLLEENISLNEVVISSKENPANRIIRSAIAARKAQLEKINSYSADFYSKGIIRLKDVPEKFLGQEVGDLDGVLDSTRSGILYLSETVSKLNYEKPDKLSEKIIASKVSGDSNGFSFNNASDVDFNFYNNTINLNSDIVSPIADYAFNYYTYKLEGIFYDNGGRLINKIKVIPRRENDRVFSGVVYIVEDQWGLYGLELSVTGEQIQSPAIDVITFKQNASYDDESDYWVLRSQTISFKFGFLGFKGNGSFVANYSKYKLNPDFEKSVFSNEILAFEPEANKKDSTYWNTLRPVPLTSEEFKDYIKKDSIQILYKSKTYLDSLDASQNKFKLGNLISGYSYENSFENKVFSISSPLSALNFNTVQGYNANLDINYTKRYDEYKKYLSLENQLNYSFETQKLRGTVGFKYKFNNINDLNVGFSAGIKVQQFNDQEPISRLMNDLSSLLFEENYMKLFENRFIKLNYGQELFNGFRFGTALSFENRRGLFNNTDDTFINSDDKSYTSNNPLEPLNFESAPFENHNILKFKFKGAFRFGQKYLSYPGSKINITNPKYPKLNFSFEKGFGATNSNYNYEHLSIDLSQNFSLENKGDFSYKLLSGTFFGDASLAFMDAKHINGNQTHVNLDGSYMSSFKNVGYYDFSTSGNYLEYHLEHDFKGYILGKIPFINKLNYNLILGVHGFTSDNQIPYNEFSVGVNNIGWKKYRFLRVDYVRSYHSGFVNDGILFGISL